MISLKNLGISRNGCIFAENTHHTYNNVMAGIYIHIPFCASRCIYCGFYSTTGLLNLQDQYVDAVIKETILRKEYLHNERVETIYIGGGTPSLLSTENIKKLGKWIIPAEGVREFTMECNPDDITNELCTTMTDIGINRVSLGVQTFSDDRLRFLRRRHKAQHVIKAIETLRKAGIKNISIDLMFGFPNESINDWEADIQQALAMEVQHISAYSLMYEEGTPLYNMRQRGLVKDCKEEDSVKMYRKLRELLAAAGYKHYEISNFARQGYQSIHNSNYWNGTPYLGLGAAAHSYDTRSRQWNINDIRKYITAIEKGIVPMNIEIIDRRTRYNDMITTALRTCDGINLNTLAPEEQDYIIRNARGSISNGLLTITDNRMKLTEKGLFVSDDVMSDLIWID